MEFEDEDQDAAGFGWTDEDWQEAAARCKCTPLQLNWVKHRLAGQSQWKAAELAGYSGTYDALRSEGSRVAASASVQHLMRLAQGDGGSDDVMDLDRMERCLTKDAKGGNPTLRVNAVKALLQIKKERGTIRKEIEASDPRDTLKEIASIDPIYAARLAVREGIADWQPDWLASVEKCSECGQIIPPDGAYTDARSTELNGAVPDDGEDQPADEREAVA